MCIQISSHLKLFAVQCIQMLYVFVLKELDLILICITKKRSNNYCVCCAVQVKFWCETVLIGHSCFTWHDINFIYIHFRFNGTFHCKLPILMHNLFTSWLWAQSYCVWASILKYIECKMYHFLNEDIIINAAIQNKQENMWIFFFFFFHFSLNCMPKRYISYINICCQR